MRTVAICGSARYKKEIAKWEEVLKAAGAVVFVPYFDWIPDEIAELEEEDRLRHSDYRSHVESEALAYLWSHIVTADVVFIFNPGESGHIGNNTRGEVFFSHARHKIIVAFQCDQEEPTTDRLIYGYAKTPEDLIRFLG